LSKELNECENPLTALALGYPPFEHREGWGSRFYCCSNDGPARPLL
jgi:hypothetical protein